MFAHCWSVNCPLCNLELPVASLYRNCQSRKFSRPYQCQTIGRNWTLESGNVDSICSDTLCKRIASFGQILETNLQQNTCQLFKYQVNILIVFNTICTLVHLYILFCLMTICTKNTTVVEHRLQTRSCTVQADTCSSTRGHKGPDTAFPFLYKSRHIGHSGAPAHLAGTSLW